MFFLQGTTDKQLVPRNMAYDYFPRLVLEFYEQHVSWSNVATHSGGGSFLWSFFYLGVVTAGDETLSDYVCRSESV